MELEMPFPEYSYSLFEVFRFKNLGNLTFST